MRAAALALLAALCAAAPRRPPGQVERVQGTLALMRQGGRHFEPLADPVGARLDPGDAVRTLAGSRAHLSLPLAAVALLKPDSDVGLEAADETSARASVLRGEALIVFTRPLDRGWTFSVRTRGGVAKVRGAAGEAERPAFWVFSEENKDSRFVVLSGRFWVSAEGHSVRVRAGQQVRVPFGGKPQDPAPARLPEGFADSFAIDGSLSGAEVGLRKPPPD